MNRLYLLMVMLPVVVAMTFVYGQTVRYYGPHITSQSPWINKIEVYNNGDQDENFQIFIWDANGQMVMEEEYTAPAHGSLVLVMTTYDRYVFGADEEELPPVEGTFVIDADSLKIRPKLSFRYGNSLSLTEFFLQETLAWGYILPNTIQRHFSWTGLALMNPHNEPLTAVLEAYRDGLMVGETDVIINARTKYVSLSDWIWGGTFYEDFDQINIYSVDKSFPPPMSITGNDAQDRHLFFNGAITADTRQAGELYATDSIVGDLYFVPSGMFTQGSPTDEPCRLTNETQFTHNLTRNLAVMETEVSRQMWNDLQAAQGSLPVDPTDTSYSSGMDNPVQNNTWYEAVLFANLLSAEQGLTRCYYTDDTMATPIDAANYDGNDTIYCHFNADGYRLPTEGEWEYFCRAGSTSPFWADEPNYNSGNCDANITTPGTWPNLEEIAWFCANWYDPTGNMTTKPVGLKEANPWGLRDVHGNVWEWCWDWYSTGYPAGSATDYTGPGSRSKRVSRGGAWNNQPHHCRSARRAEWTPRLPCLQPRLPPRQDAAVSRIYHNAALLSGAAQTMH